jgi:hypothetical protein
MKYKFKKNDIIYFFDEGRFIKARVDIYTPRAMRVEGLNINSSFSMFTNNNLILSKHSWIVKLHEIIRIIKA